MTKVVLSSAKDPVEQQALLCIENTRLEIAMTNDKSMPLKDDPAIGAVAGGVISLLIASGVSAMAQPVTSDPQAWRPMSYADLQRPIGEAATYFDIWKDAIDANNREYLRRGDKRFSAGNAPAVEAHFVIWSSRKSVVLSVLNTAAACSLKEQRAVARVTIKLCPLRLAFYEGVLVRTLDGGRACFLEREGEGNDSERARAVAYASYDVSTKTLKTGLVIDHQAVDGCSQHIPLYPPE